MNYNYDDNKWTIFAHKSLPSTQDEAKRLNLDITISKPFVVVADEQTAGRGRAGNKWTSFKNNLQCTIVMNVDIDVCHAGQYAFIVGLALAQTLTDLGIKDIKLKWPNDVLVNGKKIAGILLESNINENKITSLLIGTGVNVADNIDDATSIYKHIKKQPTPNEVLKIYLNKLDNKINDFNKLGFLSIRKEWLSMAYKLGEIINVRLPNETFSGKFIDIADDGSLIIKTNGKDTIRKIYSGDVFFERT